MINFIEINLAISNMQLKGKQMPNLCTVVILCTSCIECSKRHILFGYIYCYAHGKVCKLCGWFGNPKAGLVVTSVRRPPGLCSLFLSFFLFVREALGSGKFYPSSFFLHCDRVEFLRCSDGSRAREESGHWINTRLGRKCIAGLLQTFRGFYELGITYYGL